MNKILVAASALMNAVLLMVLFGPLQFFLYSSIVLLIAGLFYIAHLISMRKEMAKEIENLLDKISIFSAYMEEIYQLEVFYGDTTIQEMIDQSKKLMNDFYDFEERFLDTTYDEEDNDTAEENSDPTQEV